MEPREKTALILSALFATWQGHPVKAFHKPAVRAQAAEFFRASQTDRFAKVARLFHSTEKETATP